MNHFKKLIIVFLSFSITSCAHLYGDNGAIKNHDIDYLKAQNIAPLKIPPGLSSSTFDTHYPVPDRRYPASAERVTLIPPELNATGK